MSEPFDFAFPRHKPQFFAQSLGALAVATRYYAFGRPHSAISRRGLYHIVQTPIANKLVATRKAFTIPCPDDVWAVLRGEIIRTGAVRSLVVYQSQWRKHRFAVLGISSDSEVVVFARIRRSEEKYVSPGHGPWIFRVPDKTAEFRVGSWWMGLFQPLPAMHDAAPFDTQALFRVSSDASMALAGRLPVTEPPWAGWVPIHGDLTPWNLRADADNNLWLIDWEQATWGPRMADPLRYVLAHGALQGEDHHALVGRVNAMMRNQAETASAATFWLEHESFNLSSRWDWERPELDRGKVADWNRGKEEALALRMLAGTANEPAPGSTAAS